MRADASFAVPVKLWALLCVFAGVTIGGNVLLSCILTGGALLYLVLQRLSLIHISEPTRPY